MRHSIRFERACAAPPEVVYDVLVDVERWPEWLSGARSAEWEKAELPGTRVGAIRRIVVSGLTMREEILTVDRPHHHAYRIVSGIPVNDHRADVHIPTFGLAVAGGCNGGNASVPSRLCTGNRCDQG